MSYQILKYDGVGARVYSRTGAKELIRYQSGNSSGLLKLQYLNKKLEKI